MRLIKHGALLLVLALALGGSAGCESVALVGRAPLPPDEIVGEVEGLDIGTREIYVRQKDRSTTAVGYTTDATMSYRGREYPATQLEVGDLVAMQVKQDSRGRFYTDLIRVQESVRDRSAARPAPRSQTLDGTVEHVDLQRGTFEVRDSSGSAVVVSLPYNARRSEIDRVQRLRRGDYVRLEGRFLNRDRFELETFL